MPILGAVLEIGSQLGNFANTIRTLTLNKGTQHVEDPEATQLAATWSTQVNNQLVGLYGQALVSAAAHEFAVNMKGLVDSGARWGDYTTLKNAMSVYFQDMVNGVNLNNQQLTSPEIMRGTLHGDAYWILRAMDRESTTEFVSSILADYRNALFPALEHQGADTSKINLSGSGVSATAQAYG